MTTLTIMRQLPREVDPLVFNMSMEDPGDVNYSSVGGLPEQIRELREVNIVLPQTSSLVICIYPHQLVEFYTGLSAWGVENWIWASLKSNILDGSWSMPPRKTCH